MESNIFHNCPQEQQQQHQQSNSKDLGSKCPRSKTMSCQRSLRTTFLVRNSETRELLADIQ